ncbi:acyltransferase family protein, partial [Photobacterium kishitanii]
MKDRYDYIDLLKGFGILLVVWGHTDKFLFKEIYAFHMPLFVFLAGMFSFKQKKLKDILFEKSKSLLIPFFIFSFSWWVITLILLKIDESNQFSLALSRIFHILGGSGQNSIFPLANVAIWFLPYLFTTFIIHYFNSKLNFKLQLIGALFIGSLGFVMSYIGIPLPYSADTAFTLYPFFYIGSIFLDNKNKNSINLSITTIPFLLVIYYFSYTNNSVVDTSSNNIGNPFLFY